ncbi:MAG: hypothetical protein Fur0022_08970 [Anaerolineales bacterium]
MKSTDLYKLLPVIYRQRDAALGEPLKGVLEILSEQANLVESDIAQLYENWFIETAEDWAVPYIADLIGYRAVSEAGRPGEGNTPRGEQRNRILIPRREVANTLRYRRRKGTLALLELLAKDVTGWPARAVEFYKLLNWTQSLNHLRLAQGQSADLRRGNALDRLDSPFDEFAHTVDVRQINSRYAQGRHNLPSVGLFIWRLKTYPVTQAPAYCLEESGPHCYTFSVLGNDTPLYTRAEPESDPTSIAGEMNLPVPIRRRAFEDHKTSYYGEEKSIQLWLGTRDEKREPLPADRIIPADLTGWVYRPPRGFVAVDPVLGRIAFHPRQLPKYGVWVSYFYGFSAEVGGGEYDRTLSQPENYALYQVGAGKEYAQIGEALKAWGKQDPQPQHAVIEITDSGVYVEPLRIELAKEKTLQLRAANHARPVIRLLDWQTTLPDALTITLAPNSHFTLDGLLITGRGMQVRGMSDEEDAGERAENGSAGITIRHSTLVPGWALGNDCAPKRPNEPSLELMDARMCLTIEHSIVGSLLVNTNPVREDPLPITIRDSVLDATHHDLEALCGPGFQIGHAAVTIERSTVFGRLCVHSLFAEESLFMGTIMVARRQIGCVRFSYVTPGSRTPRRYQCQPDLVDQATMSEADRTREQLRVRPQFNSAQYGTPTYCQLAHACAEEIQRGAEDESEMGVFHTLYQPQRAANLRARLDEFTPAGTDTGIIFAS